jgi:hypothetical protein
MGLGIPGDPGGPESFFERNGNMVKFNGCDFHWFSLSISRLKFGLPPGSRLEAQSLDSYQTVPFKTNDTLREVFLQE